MRKSIFALFIAAHLAGCALAPTPSEELVGSAGGKADIVDDDAGTPDADAATIDVAGRTYSREIVGGTGFGFAPRATRVRSVRFGEDGTAEDADFGPPLRGTYAQDGTTIVLTPGDTSRAAQTYQLSADGETLTAPGGGELAYEQPLAGRVYAADGRRVEFLDGMRLTDGEQELAYRRSASRIDALEDETVVRTYRLSADGLELTVDGAALARESD